MLAVALLRRQHIQSHLSTCCSKPECPALRSPLQGRLVRSFAGPHWLVKHKRKVPHGLNEPARPQLQRSWVLCFVFQVCTVYFYRSNVPLQPDNATILQAFSDHIARAAPH